MKYSNSLCVAGFLPFLDKLKAPNAGGVDKNRRISTNIS